MKGLSRAVLLFALGLPLWATADPIEVVPLSGGEHPTSLGPYAMTPFDEPNGTGDCTPSTSGGEACFFDISGSPLALPAESPSWWRYDGSPAPDHGNVFVVREHNWVRIVLPPQTRAFSLFVGARSNGRAWVQALDNLGNSTDQIHFRVGRNKTRGYGFYTEGCGVLTDIIVDPIDWGFGYFASNQGACAVSEPPPLALFLAGLLGLGAMGALKRRTTRAR